MKCEKDAKKVEGEREEVKNEGKKPYTRPELTRHGGVERFTGGQLS